MAVWNPDNLMITQKGQLLLSKLQAGEGQATITKVLTGAGRVSPSQLYTQTAVSQPKQNCVVASKETYETGSVLGLQVSNKDLATSYVINQIGVYASHPDMGEILYMIGQCDENTGDIMPLPSVTPVTMNYGFYVIHSKDANIVITVDPAGVVTNQRFDTLISRVSDIATFVGYSDNSDVWGVEWDITNKTVKRLGASIGLVGGADHNNFRPWQRRRCVLNNLGKVVKYYGESGYTENGSLGSVMVEQPSFWYKTVPVESVPAPNGQRGRALTKVRYYISDKPRVGFKIHPNFARGLKNEYRDFVYHSAYEGGIFDTSAQTLLLNDEQVADFAVDCLSSVAGSKPASGLTQNLTRANVRKLANNIGQGWQQMDFVANSANLLLHLVEYASFDCQTTIGKGVSEKTDDGATNMSNVTGATSSLGNASGMATGANGLVSITYRGEENPWGNIWKWEDGLNIEARGMNNAVFASGYYNGVEATPASGYYADDVGSTAGAPMYKDCGFSLARANGYVSKIGYSEECDFAFLAVETTGASNYPINDYFYQNNQYAGWYVSALGGRWDSGLGCGLGDRYVNNASSDRARYVGGRLLFVPKSTVEPIVA